MWEENRTKDISDQFYFFPSFNHWIYESFLFQIYNSLINARTITQLNRVYYRMYGFSIKSSSLLNMIPHKSSKMVRYCIPYTSLL